jgi:hypothetical protein
MKWASTTGLCAGWGCSGERDIRMARPASTDFSTGRSGCSSTIPTGARRVHVVSPVTAATYGFPFSNSPRPGRPPDARQSGQHQLLFHLMKRLLGTHIPGEIASTLIPVARLVPREQGPRPLRRP